MIVYFENSHQTGKNKGYSLLQPSGNTLRTGHWRLMEGLQKIEWIFCIKISMSGICLITVSIVIQHIFAA